MKNWRLLLTTALLSLSLAQPALAMSNKARGEKFMEQNRKQEGVINTYSGLQYKVLKEGTGRQPRSRDRVTVHYEGKNLDGKVFDTTYTDGQAVTFKLNQVIKGWTQGLQLMKEGGKAVLYIPPYLAYGEKGSGREIGRNETLIFTVELIKVSP
ncbi:FKBP-type peptidyl-prolyl cis-trans isomerase [Catenovulum sp. SM1970]|uniref:FKBP-type peptidyl-prolyl cis-trans isomerase n=1 Tax=Marinifaba aquimaris TaxID=2741323 RepID=UPI0015742640|nr:FKBP-type peptidyl-prolyl cis-trans isomerase [Marinifaba aquimaris]NTS78829.1 FKBP-type peptidyl-prolyl cis-trans isomerase [Marinifaba aquimaris]